MHEVEQKIEVAFTEPEVQVVPAEYTRLLGYPHGWELEGRAQELADWARQWYAEHGRPWMYARQADRFQMVGDSIELDGVPFTSKRLESTLRQAEAHGAILVVVGAGPEAEEEARRRWLDEKPDEYFFLEMFASAVVEHLTTLAGARLCDWAEQRGMAVLPHYSPGYPDWDVSEQSHLLKLVKKTRQQSFPGQVEVLDSGMLRPKKTQLAVFGLTRHSERFARITSLIPCESCSYGPCQYRRAPYRNAPRSCAEQVQICPPVLDPDASYSVNRKALKRWAEQRLSLEECPDGSLQAVFRFEGTTCTNTGWPLAFDYKVKLGPRREGYPIREQSLTAARGDAGHVRMCQYLEDSAGLMAAIENEKPLRGERLNAVLSWRRPASGAGCFCEASARDHKWGLVLETIHFALAQRELNQDGRH
jgi:hypothetical protein